MRLWLGCDNCPCEEIGCKFLHYVAKNVCPCRHEEIGSIQNETDSEKKIDNEENYESDEEFITNKMDFECDECMDIMQCTDCFVRLHEATGELKHGTVGLLKPGQFERQLSCPLCQLLLLLNANWLQGMPRRISQHSFFSS